MQKIYCVEDDESVRELVIYALQSSGFEAQGFVNAEEFFPVLKNNVPDLILLDIMLPGIDGIEILKEVRKNPKTQHTPIIMLTARGSEYDKITGLGDKEIEELKDINNREKMVRNKLQMVKHGEIIYRVTK